MMKRNMKRAASAILAGTMLLGVVSGCTDSAADPSGAVEEEVLNVEYPVTPEELGSGEVKWAEEETADGWMKVTNEGGDTLGYSPDSGVSLIQVDGYAFKDLNKNGVLDAYEDWRQSNDVRAEDLAAQLSAEEIAGLMLFPGVFDKNTATDYVDQGIRTMLSFDTTSPTADQAEWSNSMQAYAEATNFGIPVTISTNPRTMNIWPTSLALGATFDPDLAFEVANELSVQYRAIGISLLLGPQIDIATDPRWRRTQETYGEDPALTRDMANAVISGNQSTYAEDGTDLGWGDESVVAMMKHWPGDGASEGGRESHRDTGKYTVYPGDAFNTHLISFVDGGLNLTSATEMVAAVMPSYSIAWSEDGSLGDLVGSGFSAYKNELLRSYGFDGLICTDFEITSDTETHWGTDDMTVAERTYTALMAGVDQLGGDSKLEPVLEAYDMMVEELGEEAALARFRESGARLVMGPLQVGLFENPYVDVAAAVEIVGGDEITEQGYDAQRQSIVMLKNDGNVIKAAEEGAEKPTVYIPMQYTAGYTSSSKASQGVYTPGSWELPVDPQTASAYFNVVTDKVSDTLTGPVDENGNPTPSENDIIRASAEELAQCDYALVIVRNPKNAGENGSDMNQGYDLETETYIPISLQYGDYTADSEFVRSESIAGDMVEVEVENPYGVAIVEEKENRSYFGQSAKITNKTDLDGILYAAENMPEDASVIVAVNATNPMIFSEFESQVDAILMGFSVNNELFFDIVTGKVEPTGLLPLQMPANMETVEAQYEDVPRDMECYVDANGNTYDFAFGLNWSGKIEDDRTAKYAVEPLTEPETQPVTAEE